MREAIHDIHLAAITDPILKDPAAMQATTAASPYQTILQEMNDLGSEFDEICMNWRAER
jgi:hypothetical protein